MRASRTVKLASATHRSSALEYSSRVRCGMSLLLSHMERIGGLSLRRAQTPFCETRRALSVVVTAEMIASYAFVGSGSDASSLWGGRGKSSAGGAAGASGATSSSPSSFWRVIRVAPSSLGLFPLMMSIRA